MMLKIQHLRKSFKEDFWKTPTVILDDLSFSLSEGSICGFLGANGAGKTTTIKSILQFIRPDSGEIFFGESLGGTWEEARKKIGFFPERPFFYPSLTGREFCHYMANLHHVSQKNAKKEFIYWAKRVNVEFALDRKIKNYSKGMLQRLGLVTCLIHKPSLIILDEPLSGLDPIGRSDFKSILKEMNQEFGTTIFFSSHILSDVEEICNDVVVIDQGKLLYEGDINELLQKHQADQLELIVKTSMPLSKPFLSDGRQKYLVTGDNETIQKLIKELPHECEVFSLKRITPNLEHILYGEDGKK